MLDHLIGLGRRPDVLAKTSERDRIRKTNSIEHLHRLYLNGDNLLPGQKAKILHLLPSDQQLTAQAEIIQAGADFWGKWTRFRCGVTEDGEATPADEPNFYHVVGLLPVVQQFANFALDRIERNTPVVVIDLMGGTGNIAPKIAKRRQVAGYVLVDGNHRVEKVAKNNLDRLGIANSKVVIHDLSGGLPDEVGAAVFEIKKRSGHNSPHILFISNWGLTYLPLEPMMRVVEQCFDPNTNAGLPTTLAFNMLKDGRFNPDEMNRRFGREIVPKKLLTCQINALKRAGAARSQIVDFGKELPDSAPIWFPEEVIEPLRQLGFNADVNDSILWRQCTGVRVNGKAA